MFATTATLLMLTNVMLSEPHLIYPATGDSVMMHQPTHSMIVEDGCDCVRPFESDRCFPRFVGPISNPVLAKDPRSLTELRGLFINNWSPSDHPVLGSGTFQVLAMQARVALSERLTFIADKDGYTFIQPRGAAHRDGWMNMAAGFKYALVRDVENQFLVSAGMMYEFQTGEADVFQSHGDGIFTFFGTIGKELGELNHVIVNMGYQLPVDNTDNSQMVYTSLHFDRQMFGWLYPLVEVNWYHYTSGGNRGIPNIVGEGDGLINLGTTGVAGNNVVTAAVGVKAMFSQHLESGIAYEFPLSDRKDLIQGRIIVEMILRF